MLLEKGYSVDIYHINQVKKETDSFTVQKNILHNMGVDFLTTEENDIHFMDSIFNKKYNVIVDAIFGVGLKRDVSGIHKQVIENINNMTGYKVAIDVPSGVNATTGKVMGTCFRADLTVTMGLTKTGLVLYPGCDMAGEIVVKDIGFPKSVVQNVSPVAFTYDELDLSRLPARRNDSNKGTYGRIAIIAGSSSMSGAATLAVRAAYRMGAGLVKLYTHENNRQIIGSTVPEAVMMNYKDSLSTAACVEDAVKWGDAILIGSGIGMGEEASHMVSYVLKNSTKPVVIDADALNIIARDNGNGTVSAGADMVIPQILADATCPVVLTPHVKEMSRLTGQTVECIKNDIIHSCIEYTEKLNNEKTSAEYTEKLNNKETDCKECCNNIQNKICVLKDARTIVSNGSREVYINTSGNNGMSTAGAGDVLAGIIVSLIGMGMEPFEAAKLGTYIHGLAGDKAAEAKGVYSMLASDIISEVSETLSETLTKPKAEFRSNLRKA
jgi:NAD(P)H-hydrate epimerase